MNKEIIKELMAEAGFDPASIERMGVMPQAEKFAELLIKECVAVADHHSDGHENDQFGRKIFHYRADIGKEIADYFGVKKVCAELNKMSDMMINFEHYTKEIYGFDYSKIEDIDGRTVYAHRKTATAFRIFCLGVRVGEMG